MNLIKLSHLWGLKTIGLKCCLFVRRKEEKGIGKQLLKYGIEKFGIKEVTANEQNPQAVGFYKHMEFVTYKRTDYDEEGNPYPLLYMKIV